MDGNSIVTTIDANIEAIVEKYIKKGHTVIGIDSPVFFLKPDTLDM